METSQHTPIEPKILQLDDHLLTTECQPFDFSDPIINPVELTNNLTFTREHWKGIGLAANQVGINTRVISVKGIESCLFNPNIVSFSDEQELSEEGCLSYPGLIVKIKRPKVIRVRYADYKGIVTTQTFVGITSRVIQHEVDHINGLIFYQRAHKYHKDQAFKKWKKNER